MYILDEVFQSFKKKKNQHSANVPLKFNVASTTYPMTLSFPQTAIRHLNNAFIRIKLTSWNGRNRNHSTERIKCCISDGRGEAHKQQSKSVADSYQLNQHWSSSSNIYHVQRQHKYSVKEQSLNYFFLVFHCCFFSCGCYKESKLSALLPTQ